MRVRSALVLIAVSITIVTGAHAQERATATLVQAPDVVRLKDGSFVRGTISELAAQDSVTIVSLTGETRRFRMSEVTYAGPADDRVEQRSGGSGSANGAGAHNEPESDRSGPSVIAGGARVRLKLTSDPPGLVFHRITGSAVAVGSGGIADVQSFQRLCSAPCTISVETGTDQFALSRGSYLPKPAEPVAILAETTELFGHYESRQGVRTVGTILAIGAAAIGGALIYGSFGKEQDCDPDLGCTEETKLALAPLAAGLIVFGVGFPIGLVLAFKSDVPKIDVRGSSTVSTKLPGLFVAGAL